MQEQIWLLSVWNTFYKGVKAKSPLIKFKTVISSQAMKNLTVTLSLENKEVWKKVWTLSVE